MDIAQYFRDKEKLAAQLKEVSAKLVTAESTIAANADTLTGKGAALEKANTELATTKTALADLQAKFDAADKSARELAPKVDVLTAELATAREEIKTLTANAKIVEDATAEALNKIGFKAEVAGEIPSGSAANSTESKLDELRAKMAAETDPKKKWELAQEAAKLRAK